MTKKKPKALHLHRGDSAEARSRKSMNIDGWMNIYTGQGIRGVDKQLGTSFGRVSVFQEQELTDIYRGDGFGRRIIDLPTGEMVRAGWFIHGDTDGDILKYLRKLKIKQKVLLALRWAKLYGGSIIVLHINDGSFPEEPVRETNIRNIENVHVYSRYRVSWTSADLYTDTHDPKFGQVKYYTINPISIGGIQPFKVHESRCIVLDGLPVDDKTRQENNGWGDSVIQSTYTQLSDLTGVYHSAKGIIDDFIQTIISIENLQEMIRAGEEALIRKRLEIIDMGRHQMNTIMLDAKEKYEKAASSVAGLAELMGKFEGAFAGVTDTPLTLLMGQSPNGFNSKDDGSMQKWYDKITQLQEDVLEPILSRIVYICMLSKQGPTKGVVLPDWEVEFNKLQQQTEAEIVEMRNKQADTDKIYIEQQVLNPEDVRISRFGGDDYSLETKVSTEQYSTEPDDIDDIE